MLSYKVKLQKYKEIYSETPPKKSRFLQKRDSKILHDLLCEWMSKWHWIFSILFIYLFVFTNSLFSLLLGDITKYQEVVNHLIIDRQNGTTVISRKHQNSWHFLTSKANSRHLPETCPCNLHPKMNEHICPKQTTYLLCRVNNRTCHWNWRGWMIDTR